MICIPNDAFDSGADDAVAPCLAEDASGNLLFDRFALGAVVVPLYNATTPEDSDVIATFADTTQLEYVELFGARVQTHRPSDQDRDRFQKLLAEWKNSRHHESKTSQLALHPAYQRIIGMGKVAVPLILEDMERFPDHWMWALRSITGENPVTDEQRGKLKLMCEAWLKWGRDHGYSW